MSAAAVQRLVIERAELDGRLVHVLIENGVVAHIGDDPGGHDGERIDAGGGALLPGLHDHHIHLLATAASMASVDVADSPTLESALAAAPGDGWVRVVGYHESLFGPLDRFVLDRIEPDRPVRVQHRSGMMWILNSAALRALDAPLPPGAGRGPGGELDGTFLREDEWLRTHVAGTEQLRFDGLSDRLRRCGIVGVTDMTPVSTTADLGVLAAAVSSMHAAGFHLDVTAATSAALCDVIAPAPLRLGPVKVLADEDALPDFDDLVEWITSAHAHSRSVAVHCVTRAVLAFVLAAFEVAGTRPRDRIEHGAVVPPELAESIRSLGLIVITQPAFVHARGEQYRRDVDSADLPHLWPCASLLEEGIAVGTSTDAPFGPLDPWLAMDVAISRRTREGGVLGARERIGAAAAMSMWLTTANDPVGRPRAVRPGSPARVCLLDRRLADALASPADVRVVRTIASDLGGRSLGDPGTRH